MVDFILGATAMAYGVAGLFFLRFWRQTHDRLFLLFGLAFWVLAGNRLALARVGESHELHIIFAVVRLVAYLVIVMAILDKNRFWKRKPSAPEPS